MKTHVIVLESHDDVISARDKISWSKAERVLLVWPRRGKVLERRVDLQLLLRYVQSLGAQMAVVTGARSVRTNARELGIPVFSTAERAHKAAWRRPRRRKFRLKRPNRDAVSLREQLKTIRESAVLPLFARLAVFGLGLAAFFTLVLLILPAAEIRFEPKRITQQVSIPIWASPELLSAHASGGLPAQPILVVVEGRETAQSTGQMRVPDRSAEGQVTFTNLTDQNVTVPAGSAVMTLDRPPKRYRTTREALVPGGSGQAVSIPVEAEAVGTPGNLPAGEIAAVEGALGLQLSAANAVPISGGRDRLSPSPSQADYQSLRKKLLANLQASAVEEIAGRVQPGQVLLPDTLQMQAVVEETRLPDANQPGDQLQLGMRVEFQALTVQEADLQSVAQSALDANLDAAYQPVPDSLHYALGSLIEAEDTQPAEAQWELQADRILIPRWSRTALARAVQGRDLDDARAILQAKLPLAAPPQIAIFPRWWPRLPFLPFRITMEQS